MARWALALSLLWPARAAADPTWDPGWARFRPAEVAVTGGLVVGTVAWTAFAPEPKPRWTGGILLDDPVREGLRARGPGGRLGADKTSDVLLWSLVAWPLVDAGIVAVTGDADDVAPQMALISAESLLVTTFLQRTVSSLVGRQRPYQRGCDDDDAYVPACHSPDSNRSFFSGHTALAVTGASLVCVQHRRLELYGGPWTCVAAGSAAASVGALRIVADRHYVSDVLVGAAVGVASGLALPRLLHFTGAAPTQDSPRSPARVVFRGAF